MNQLVSPMLNDALAAAGVAGAAFLREFEAAYGAGGVWVASRSGFNSLAGSPVHAKRWGDVIAAEALLAPGVLMEETMGRGLLRVPINFPATMDVAIIGRPIGAIVGHPLTARVSAVVKGVTRSADGLQRLLPYHADPEPLLP